MGNTGSLTEDKKRNYDFEQDGGRKSSKKKLEDENDLWIPTPTTTSVFSELDKHSYAAEMFEDNLKPIQEESEDGSVRKSQQNGRVKILDDTHFTMSSKSLTSTKVTQPENRSANRLVFHHKPNPNLVSERDISKSMEALTFSESQGNEDAKFGSVRYSATIQGNSHYRSNPAINAIPVARFEKRAPPPQRSASMRVVKLEAGPWAHQKPTTSPAQQLPLNHDLQQRHKVTRRSSWTPSTSRFKKLFLLNKPEENAGPVYQRSLSHGTGEKYYQRSADGQIVAISPESTLRTSQWVAQHSGEAQSQRSSSNSQKRQLHPDLVY